ncbi:MAG: transcription antitermination factor NusB [Pseudomonadota bacterium]
MHATTSGPETAPGGTGGRVGRSPAQTARTTTAMGDEDTAKRAGTADGSTAADAPARVEGRDRAARAGGAGGGRAPARLARAAARLAAVQALYQMEVAGGSWTEVRDEFEAHRLGTDVEGLRYPDPDVDHFRAILGGVQREQVRIDHLTDDALVARWSLHRIDATLRALMRAAGWELVGATDVPAKVVIGEYVDIAKAFYPDGREPRFVNGVLDHMAREARPGELAPR